MKEQAFREAKELSKDGNIYFVLEDEHDVQVSAYIDLISSCLETGYAVTAAFKNGAELKEEEYVDDLEEALDDFNSLCL